MARRLDEFPGAAARRYPWEQWLNGEVWQLSAGEDFTSKPGTVVQSARARARRMGGGLRTRLLHEDGNVESVVLQFVARPE